ncbi:MAG TPA: site-specific DNA-methyltransferase [Hyphomicrobium sp.]|nr:site-specific DNA-methyltransferase [Hyphomicrobium sp.]
MRFEIGNGEFHVGDCFDVMREMQDGSVDMILCDLPYGTTSCKWDSVLPLDALWSEYRRIAKPNAVIVLTANQPFTAALVTSNISEFKYAWVWIKSNASGFANAKKQPLRAFEDVLVFYRSQPTYNPQGVVRLAEPKRRTKDTGDFMGRTGFRDGYEQEFTNYPKNILDFRSHSRGFHPTQKPVALFEYLIRTYTDEGMTVLDNTAGSGTTAIAAENASRQWICIERDEEYAEKAMTRIRDHVSGESQPVKKVVRKPRVMPPAPTHEVAQVSLF